MRLPGSNFLVAETFSHMSPRLSNLTEKLLRKFGRCHKASQNGKPRILGVRLDPPPLQSAICFVHDPSTWGRYYPGLLKFPALLLPALKSRSIQCLIGFNESQRRCSNRVASDSIKRSFAFNFFAIRHKFFVEFLLTFTRSSVMPGKWNHKTSQIDRVELDPDIP